MCVDFCYCAACSAEPTWARLGFDHKWRTRNEEEQALCGLNERSAEQRRETCDPQVHFCLEIYHMVVHDQFKKKVLILFYEKMIDWLLPLFCFLAFIPVTFRSRGRTGAKHKRYPSETISTLLLFSLSDGSIWQNTNCVSLGYVGGLKERKRAIQREANEDRWLSFSCSERLS